MKTCFWMTSQGQNDPGDRISCSIRIRSCLSATQFLLQAVPFSYLPYALPLYSLPFLPPSSPSGFDNVCRHSAQVSLGFDNIWTDVVSLSRQYLDRYCHPDNICSDIVTLPIYSTTPIVSFFLQSFPGLNSFNITRCLLSRNFSN